MTAVAHIAVEDLQPACLVDAELLRGFVEKQDSQAFTQLVERNRGLVLGVCHRVLRDGHDVEDVFQTTFLVLVRDAVHIRKQKSIASWLYGVAFRLALRVARQKSQRRETRLMEVLLTEFDTLNEVADRHDRQLLDTELNGLPERFRQPLILKYLVGKTTREIANELKITDGTVDGLIKRGKDELRTRLMARGVRLGVVIAAVQLSHQVTAAAPMPLLVESTVQASLAWQQDGLNVTSSDLISDRVLDLSAKELVTMSISVKAGLIVGTALGVMALGFGMDNLRTGFLRRADAGIVTSLQSVVSQSAALENAAIVQAEKSDELIPETVKVAQNPLAEGGTHSDSAVTKAEQPVKQPRQWDLMPRSRNVRRVEMALTESTEVAFTDVPLVEALNYLEDVNHIGIMMDKTAMHDEGINADTQISLTMSGVSFKSTLRLMLNPLALDYVIKNDVLLITTKAAAEEMFETRVYDVSRLTDINPADLEEIVYATIEPNSWNVKSRNVASAVATNEQATSKSSASSTTSIKPNAEGSAHSSSNEKMTAPNSANTSTQAGGTEATALGGGSIRSTKRTLVIRQTQRVHEEIVNLLEQLEQSMNTDEMKSQEKVPSSKAPAK